MKNSELLALIAVSVIFIFGCIQQQVQNPRIADSSASDKNLKHQENNGVSLINKYKVFPEVWSSNAWNGQTYEFKTNCFGNFTTLEECFLWNVTRVTVKNTSGMEFNLNKDFNIDAYSGEVTRRWVLYGPYGGGLPTEGMYNFSYYKDDELLLAQIVDYKPKIIGFPTNVSWKIDGNDLVVAWVPPDGIEAGMWYKVIVFPKNKALFSKTLDWNSSVARLENVPLVKGDEAELSVAAFFNGGYSYPKNVPIIWQ